MLQDGLPRHPEPARHGQPGAQLEQGLTVPFLQRVEERAPRWRGQSLEGVAHHGRIVQVNTCLSSRWITLRMPRWPG
jgi:hypothetical protein